MQESLRLDPNAACRIIHVLLTKINQFPKTVIKQARFKGSTCSFMERRVEPSVPSKVYRARVAWPTLLNASCTCKNTHFAYNLNQVDNRARFQTRQTLRERGPPGLTYLPHHACCVNAVKHESKDNPRRLNNPTAIYNNPND